MKDETLFDDDPTGAAAGDRIGRLLDGKYRIVRKLGEGGMGTVYEARHEVVGRRFAVKFLHAQYAMHGDVLSRFKREAFTAGTLESEHIVAATDFSQDVDGASYIVMEYLEGTDLRGLLSRLGTLPAARISNLIVQACRGLRCAHEANIVHRDLKPENLFVAARADQTDLCKILDFGIARFRRRNGTNSTTREGVLMGTPHYMSPEQLRGDTDIDERADVYSLGTILYEALTGQCPHAGIDMPQLVFKICCEEPVPVETLCPKLPEGMAEVVHQALALDRNERFSSVRALELALLPFAASQPKAADVPDEAARAAAVTGPSDATAAEWSGTSSAPRSGTGEVSPFTKSAPGLGEPVASALPLRRQKPRLVLLGIAALLVASVGVLLWRNGDAKTDGRSHVNVARTSAPSAPTAPAREQLDVAEQTARTLPQLTSTPAADTPPVLPTAISSQAVPLVAPPASASPAPKPAVPARPSEVKGRRGSVFDTANPYQ